MIHKFIIEETDAVKGDFNYIIQNCLISCGLKPNRFRFEPFTLHELHQMGVKSITISHNPIFSATHISITT